MVQTYSLTTQISWFSSWGILFWLTLYLVFLEHNCVTVCVFKWTVVSAILAFATRRTQLFTESLHIARCTACELEINEWISPLKCDYFANTAHSSCLCRLCTHVIENAPGTAVCFSVIPQKTSDLWVQNHLSGLHKKYATDFPNLAW